ncbi:MAG: acetyl-CoA carboxylase biotin carboxyl carrier protein subunit, partial [Saprospiraceae bacterium]|nr:acetyl-CoA carboxylase biotin carboxyl carrier protein subunit [Saprospiraceae bacterium]
PLEGKFFQTKDSSEKPLKGGDTIEKGTIVGYIESMKVINSVSAEFSGTVAEIVARHGEEIEEDDVIMRIR